MPLKLVKNLMMGPAYDGSYQSYLTAEMEDQVKVNEDGNYSYLDVATYKDHLAVKILADSIDIDAQEKDARIQDLKVKLGRPSNEGVRVRNIEALLEGYLYRFEIDDARTIASHVPNDAMPYAFINIVSDNNLIWSSTTGDSIDLSDVGVKYFPNGMKHVGDVFDYFDFENMVAVQCIS